MIGCDALGQVGALPPVSPLHGLTALYGLRSSSCHLLGLSLGGGARLSSWARQEILSWDLVSSFSLKLSKSKDWVRGGLGRSQSGVQTSAVASEPAFSRAPCMRVGCQQRLSWMLTPWHLALPCTQFPPTWAFLGSCPSQHP